MLATTADRLHALAIHVLRYARVVDVESGVSAPRLSVLSVLVFGGPRTVTELAVAEQVATPTMTRLLNSLEAEGYVQRTRDRHDARIVRVRATARGSRVLQAGREARVQRLNTLLERLNGEERAQVADAIDVLANALRQAIEAELG